MNVSIKYCLLINQFPSRISKMNIDIYLRLELITNKRKRRGTYTLSMCKGAVPVANETGAGGTRMNRFRLTIYDWLHRSDVTGHCPHTIGRMAS